MKLSQTFAAILFLCSSISRPATAEPGHSLSLAGPSSIVTGECIAIGVSRSNSNIASQVILSGWMNQFGVFRASDCRSQYLPPQSALNFSAGQSSQLIYVSGFVAPGQGSRTETLRAWDSYGATAQLSVLVKPPALLFSGTTTAISTQCVEVKVTRAGGNSSVSAPVVLSGWSQNFFSVSRSKDCRSQHVFPNASLNFPAGQNSLSLYLSGYLPPGQQQRGETIVVTDPSRQLTSATLRFTIKPAALIMSGANSQITGRCQPIKIERIGFGANALGSRLVLTGWDPAKLFVTQAADCRAASIPPRGPLYWQPGQTAMTLYVIGLVQNGKPAASFTLTAIDSGGQYASASFNLQILPPSFVVSGPASLVQSTCKAVKIERFGIFSPAPSYVELNGWSNLMGVTLSPNCTGGFFPRRTRVALSADQLSMSVTVYVTAVTPDNQPRNETITASDPSGQFLAGSLGLLVQPRAP